MKSKILVYIGYSIIFIGWILLFIPKINLLTIVSVLVIGTLLTVYGMLSFVGD